MIKTQVVKEDNKPVAVVLDYNEYKRLREIEQDKIDYETAIDVKNKNNKWVSHNKLKKELGI